MKLSIFVAITKPEERQDPWREALTNFTEFADEVVVVCGDKSDLELDFPNKDKIKLVYNKWRSNDYMMYGEQYRVGFENTTGDWAIRCDIDYFFHEDDFENIRDALESTPHDVLFMAKKQFILKDRYRVKALMPIVFRSSLRGSVTFDSGGDYTWPRVNKIEVVNKNNCVFKKEFVVITDSVSEEQVEERLPGVQEENGMTFCMNKRIPVYNYDFTWKTKEVIAKEFLKQSKARLEKMGSSWGQTEEEALNYLVNMQLGRLKKSGWTKTDDHPKHIKNKEVKPNMLGYDLFGNFKE